MDVGPETLLAVDREVTWTESHGILRRVPGPVLTVPGGEALTWFDPLDGRPQARSEMAAGEAHTFVTAVEWPPGFPERMSGAAVGVGDPAAVVAWASTGDDGEPACFSTDRGVACVVTSRRAPEAAALWEDFAYVKAMLGSVNTSMIHPLEISGEVVGVAFDCGMGASTNWIHSGRDVDGRVVCLLADLDLLTDAELASA